MWDTARTKGEIAANAILHFVSFELYPLSHSQAKTALDIWPELKKYSQILIANWPKRAFGCAKNMAWR